mgnify:CR=1 FL=1
MKQKLGIPIPRVGDLLKSRKFPDMIGFVLRVNDVNIEVSWINNKYYPKDVIWSTYWHFCLVDLIRA